MGGGGGKKVGQVVGACYCGGRNANIISPPRYSSFWATPRGASRPPTYPPVHSSSSARPQTHYQTRPFNASPSYHIFPTRFNNRENTTRVKKKTKQNKRTAFLFSWCEMQIKKLKVRPQKSTRSFPARLCVPRTLFIYSFASIDPPVVLCGPELASMLGCWAATKDVKSLGPCGEHAQALFNCMRTAVRPLPTFCFSFPSRELTKYYPCAQPTKRKQHRPSINYHLARLGKTLKD
jgi:hypothetical protein